MHRPRKAGWVALASVSALALAACHKPAARDAAATGGSPAVPSASPAGPSGPRVTPGELTAYLDWSREVRDEASAALHRAAEEVQQDTNRQLNQSPAEAMKHLQESPQGTGEDPIVRQRVAEAKRNRERMEALMAREPLKGSIKGEAIRNVLQAVYASGTFFRNEQALEPLRARFGRPLVDSILDQEPLIREKLDPAPSGCTPGAPRSKAPGLADFMDGTGAVCLGMTEDEVSEALGSKPTERKELAPPGTEALWRVGGKLPGTVLGRFSGGPLIGITFTAALGDLPLPRVTPAQVSQLTGAEVAIAAVEKKLRMDEILAVTQVPGRRLSWELMRTAADNKLVDQVRDTWVWEIAPGGRVLIVSKLGDTVDEPYVRELHR